MWCLSDFLPFLIGSTSPRQGELVPEVKMYKHEYDAEDWRRWSLARKKVWTSEAAGRNVVGTISEQGRPLVLYKHGWRLNNWCIVLVLFERADIIWTYHSNTNPSKKGEPSKYTQNNISIGFNGVKFTQNRSRSSIWVIVVIRKWLWIKISRICQGCYLNTLETKLDA